MAPPNKNLGGHVASLTPERKFSSLRRLKNYLRSTMKQERLNKNPLRIHYCLLVPTNNAKGILEYLSRDMLMAECSVSSD